jgi:hypothetical protein
LDIEYTQSLGYLPTNLESTVIIVPVPPIAGITLQTSYPHPKQGAMCLDGTPPGYLMRNGTGDGAKKYIIHLMGGGWCTNTKDCYNRTTTIFGSSKDWPMSYQLFGLFSDDEKVNPDFYNWNAVFFMYCDGGSFAGDV